MKMVLCAAVLLLGGCDGGLPLGIDFSEANSNCPSSPSSDSSVEPRASEELSRTAGLPVGTL